MTIMFPIANMNGHIYNICMKLLKDFKNCGRILYIDNFYTRVKLCKGLSNSQTYASGSLRSNRKGNSVGVCKKKEEAYGEQNEVGIRVIKWVDKRSVIMISFVPNHIDQLISILQQRS